MAVHNEYHREPIKKNKSGLYIVAVLVLVFCVICVLCFHACGKLDDGSVSSVGISREETSSKESSVVATSSKTSTSSLASTSSKTSTSSKASTSSSASSSKKTSSTSSKVSTSSTSTDNIKAYLPNGDWRLIIANKQHPLPESYKINVGYASGNYRLDSRIIDSYKKMISAAKNDGITLMIISGFRTYDGQKTLFNNKVNQYLNKGYSKEKAKELAAQYVAPPGTSEHLTGLAVDLISTNWYSYNSDLNSNFENTKEFEWLYNNCAKYGFILRYPKDKVGITGYSYEPWHYRYVGEEAAQEIMSKKICLEEYASKF